MNPQGSGTQTSLLSNHKHTITNLLLMMDLMTMQQDIIRLLMEKQYIQ